VGGCVSEGPEGVVDGGPGSVFPFSETDLPQVFLSGFPWRKSSSGREWGGFGMDHEIASGFHEDRDGHWLESAVGFEGFELIELEETVQPPDGCMLAEKGLLEIPAVVSEEDKSSSECDAGGSKESCGLSECDL